MAGTDVINRGPSEIVITTKPSSSRGIKSDRRNNYVTAESTSSRTHRSLRYDGNITSRSGHNQINATTKTTNSKSSTNNNINTAASTVSGVHSTYSGTTGAARSVSRSRQQGGRPSGSVTRAGRSRQKYNDAHKTTGGKTSRHHSRDVTPAANDVDNKRPQQISLSNGESSGAILPPIARLSKDLGEPELSPRPNHVTSNSQSGNNTLPGFPFTRLATRGGVTPDLQGHLKNSRPDSVFANPLPTSNSPNLTHYDTLGRGITNNSLLVASSASPDPLKSVDAARASPIANSADKAKIKFEKKVLNTMTENDGVVQAPSSPKGAKDASTTDGAPQGKQHGEGQSSSREVKSRQHRTSMKSDMKSLPKVTPAEEPPFSIRQKIEQFRKWHEEQYKDKLKQLKVEGDQPTESSEAKPAADSSKSTRQKTFMETGPIDFAKILEENIIQNRNSELAFKKRHEKQLKGIVSSPRQPDGRPLSSVTWKTWRGVNQSDAYTDVEKYIRDNELMDDERKAWIKLWIKDVHKAMEQMGDEIIVMNHD